MVELHTVAARRQRWLGLDDSIEYARVTARTRNQGIVMRDRVLGEKIRTKRQQLVEADDLLVAEIDAKVGGFGVVGADLAGAVVSGHYFTFVLDRTRVDVAWFDQVVRTGILSRQVDAVGSTNYAAIRADDVLAFRLPLPPLAEQRAIARVLGGLDHQIACTVRLAEALGRAHKAWVLSLVQGARLVALGQIAKIRNGVTPSRARADYWNCGTIAWVTSGKVSEGRIENADQFVTSTAAEECRMRVFPAGTLLIGLIGQGKTRGTVAELRIDATINQNVAAVAVETGTSSGFVGAYLRCAYESLRAWGHGTGPDALSCATLATFPIPLPPLATQEKIAHLSETIQIRLTTETAHLTALRTFRRHLADALLSGRLRIPAHLWPAPDAAPADGAANAA